MKMAWLVHGFNVSDGGRDSIDRLYPALDNRGWTVRPKRLDYGWRIITQLWGNPKVADELAGLADPGDVAIGHSNGCSIIHRATHLQHCELETIVYINPALDTDATPGPCVKRCLVLFAEDDRAVLLATLIPGVLWGAMGRFGYRGKDPRILNLNLNKQLQAKTLGHSGALKRHPRALGHLIADWLGRRIVRGSA
jgi:hypothetical protein